AKLDEAWNNMYRGRANANVLAAAVQYRVRPDERYLAYIRKVVGFYAADYDAFDNRAVAPVFDGKIMNQHLDDAVAMMTILLGLTMVRDRLDPGELSGWYERLFVREAELFDFFAFRIYNIPVWIRCAEAMIGVFFGAQELIDRAFAGAYGILDQLRRGVTPEGLWYEGSVHYHFYALQPLLYLLFACRSVGYEGPEVTEVATTVERMLVYPLSIAFRNGRLPNPHDAHPLITLGTYAEHYDYASALFDNPLFGQTAAFARRLSGSPATLSRLLFDAGGAVGDAVTRPGEPTSFGTVNHPRSFTAMLRSTNTELFVKYGLHTTLHAHPDAITIELAFDGDVVSYDLGSGGYASFLFVEWQRLTPSHNTVVTDMKNTRALYDGIVEEFDPQAGLLHVRAKGVYDAVNYSRRIVVGDRVGDHDVDDAFSVDARREHLYDWFFYCAGEPHSSRETTPVPSLGTENGYQHLFDVRKFATDGAWSVDFELPDKTIRVEMSGAAGTEVHLVNSYTDSTAHTRWGLMVRRREVSTTFNARYRCIRNP
ncbi:MAG: hypothetical protein EA382_00055, partial [Spirochaetaceae bacterium]